MDLLHHPRPPRHLRNCAPPVRGRCAVDGSRRILRHLRCHRRLSTRGAGRAPHLAVAHSAMRHRPRSVPVAHRRVLPQRDHHPVHGRAPSTGTEPCLHRASLLHGLLFVTTFPVAFEFLLERGGAHLGMALAVIVLGHLWLRKRHRDIVRLDSGGLPLEEDEDDFPLRLGLRF